MLTFIFKYTWIGMIIIVYTIWSIASIKDIIDTNRMHHNSFSLDDIDESTGAWIIISIIITFIASFGYWLFYSVE